MLVCVKLVGAHKDKIVSTVQKLLNDKEFYNSMKQAANPYGDGFASKRIADAIVEKFKN